MTLVAACSLSPSIEGVDASRRLDCVAVHAAMLAPECHRACVGIGE